MQKKGYTLIEALVTLAILAIVVVTLSAAFTNALRSMNNAKSKIVATAVGDEILERLRNMTYNNIGVVGYIPAGNIPKTQTITRSGTPYAVDTRIDYIDDLFDGCVGEVTGQPNQSLCADGTIVDKPPDTVPTDYKRGEITITWPDNAIGIQLTARFAANGLENATNTGALLITVHDSSGGIAVSNASVHVTNPDVAPPVDITLPTDVNGNLQLLSLLPSTLKYHIVVTKSGYSTDGTYPITAGNPNPHPGDLTVEAQSPTEIGFYIDRVSTLNAATYTQDCAELPNFSFNLFGKKIIGDPPPSAVLKYNVAHQTDANGKTPITDLEWGDYDIRMNTSGYDIAGYSPPNALKVSPGSIINWTLILAPHTTNSLLLNVVDANTKLPITDAQVTLSGGANGGTKQTGRGFIQQTDWSQGPGQESVGDPKKYQSDDGNIDVTSTPGVAMLKSTDLTPVFSESFSSDAQEDTTTTTANWDTSTGRLHLPESAGVYQASAAGQSNKLNTAQQLFTSVTLAATDFPNGQTIQYFVAADGVSFELVTPGVAHTFTAPGSDLRFRIELSTTDTNVTPEVDQISLTAQAKQYNESAELISSSFDLKSSSSFSTISWNPSSQIAGVGADPVKFQIATNTDDTTWNFIGPDGTDTTYYTTPNTQIASANNDSQYIRYKLFLHTDDTASSPVLSDVSIGFTSQCTPPGQVFYSSLNATTYTIDASHASYQPFSGNTDISGSSTATIQMIPL